MWQDYVLTAVSIVFIIALLPAAWAKEKPPISTSAMTGGGLGVIAGVDVTLGLGWTALTTAATACLWWILACQKALTTGR